MGQAILTVKRHRSIFSSCCFCGFCACVGAHVAHTIIGMDYEQIKLKLAARDGQWSAIAREARVDRKTIYLMLTDPNHNPKYATLRRLSQALRVIRPAK